MNYLVLAMKRSGHHVLTEWLRFHTGLPFYNNVCFGWEYRKLLTMRYRKEARNGIANIEDFNPDDWGWYDFEEFPFLKECKVIVFMRSLNNWLASCYKRKFRSVSPEHKDVYLYLNKPYINDSKKESPSRIDLYAKQLEMISDNDRVIAVCYDTFITDVDSRKDLAKTLGFEWDIIQDTNAISRMTSYGNGSSFDKHPKDARKMKVLERDKDFINDKEYNLLCGVAIRGMMKKYVKMKEFFGVFSGDSFMEK